MKILKSNNFDVKIVVFKLKGENALRMIVNLLTKWNHDVVYRGYVGLSDDDDARGFDISDSETNCGCSFCLVPENQAERDFLRGERFHRYNKDQCCWIFTPFSKDTPEVEWEVIENKVVKTP